MSIQIKKATTSGLGKIDWNNLLFGKEHSDHLYMADYADGTWKNNRIVPFEHITLSPFSLCFHYGQTMFEGMKAFRMHDGKVSIFRLEKYHKRMNATLKRMCMPEVSFDMFREALTQFVILEKNWVPSQENFSLYLRPMMIATEERVSVKASEKYLMMILGTPVGPYLSHAIKVKAETKYVRAAAGGTGSAKCGGNYGAAFYPSMLAKDEGFDQILWTDAKEHTYVEEFGAMNAMFYFDDKLITPPLSDSILDGITRDSLLTIAKDKNLNIEERRISIHEIATAISSGKKVEAFGAGTAAVVAPVESIQIDGKKYNCYIGDDAMMFQLKKALTAIRQGTAKDSHGWNTVIE